MHKHRIIALLLVLCICLSLVPVASAATPTLQLGEKTTVTVSKAGGYQTFTICLSEGKYRFRSFAGGDLDPWCKIYDEDWWDCASSDDDDGYNFDFTIDVTGTWIYYVRFGLFSTSSTGSYTVLVEKVEETAQDPAWNVSAAGVLTISGSGAIPDYDYDGAPWYASRSAITKIVIGEGITSIGAYAFYDLSNVTKVTFPDSLTRIGSYAFGFCSSLLYAIIPSNVTDICSGAFAGCESLVEVQLPSSLKILNSSMFWGCSSLQEIIIPDSVVKVNDYVFRDCTALTRITFPSSVSYIGHTQFHDCESLRSITILNPDCTIQYAYTWEANAADEGGSRLMYLSSTGNVPVVYGYAGSTAEKLAYYIPDSDYVEGSEMTFETLGDAPTISVQPVSQSIYVGDQAVFSVGASGEDLTYQWMFRTASNKTWENASADGKHTPTLTVPGTLYRSGNQYRCRITDKYGYIVYSDPVTLTVSAKTLSIITQPTTQKVIAGNTATFSVEATGAGLSYQWQYRTSSTGTWKNCTATGNTTAAMKVSATTSKSSFQYRCKITDSSGNIGYTKTVYLYVLGVKTQPTTQKVKAGSTATFTVSATGAGKTYQWQYRTSSTGTWKNCTATGNTTATMTVPASTSKSSYQYRCKISDNAGNVIYTNTVSLYVLGITAQPAPQYVIAGNSAKFTVSATGSNKTYQWQYRTSSSGTWKSATATGNKTAALTVPATTGRNGYQYRCKITDSAGNVIYSNAVTLYVLGITSQPANKSVSAGTTAKFTVSATGGGLNYQWQYRTSSTGSWKNCTISSACTATLSISATASKNGYQYRCVITDAAGNKVYSSAVTLTVK